MKLTIYSDTSLARGDVPDEWRQANVSPVFKKGEKYDAANYRPVRASYLFQDWWAEVTHGAKKGGSFSEMMGPSISNLP